jgi:hypothetical protein
VPRFSWTGTESNRRHMDFQSIALPAELPVRIFPDLASDSEAKSGKIQVDLPSLTSKQAQAPMTIGPPPYSVSGIGYIKIQQLQRKINITKFVRSVLTPDSVPFQDVARDHDLLNFICSLEDRIYSRVAIEPLNRELP